MHRHYTICLLVIVFSCLSIPTITFAQQPLIYVNEIMASNSSTLADETGSYEDWIELFNPGNTSVDLTGYSITDDPSKPTKFKLTNGVVPAGGYLVIWASGYPERGVLHTSFALSASGENVCLYSPEGVFIDSLAFGSQRADISYGRKTDGSSSLVYFASATPGLSNDNAVSYLGILSTPVFSTAAGFYNTPFTLSITNADPGVTIIYTLDGSMPDPANLAGTIFRYKNQYAYEPGQSSGSFLTDTCRSALYTTPFSITNAAENPNRFSVKSSTYDFTPAYFPAELINKGTIVRAKAYKEGYMPSNVSNATYFISSSGNPYSLPVISLGIQQNYMYDYDSGVYNAGIDFENWRAVNSTVIADGGASANWQRSTDFPLSFELFEANSTKRSVHTNSGFSMHGGWSRANPVKTLRIYFKSEYGESEIGYKVFSDLSYTGYETLLLHNGGNDYGTTLMRDMVAQHLVKDLHFDTQDGQPAIVFINGEFWGIHGIKQRYDKKYFKLHYDIDENELDLLENNAEISEGDNADYLDLRNFIENNDMSDAANYIAVGKRMDLENYIDYQAAEIFSGNNDWPHNNIRYFRKRVAYNPAASEAQDGRWRWLMYDMDFAFGLNTGVDNNTLDYAINDPIPWSSVIFRKLLYNPGFRQHFINRYADLLNTTFLSSNITASIDLYTKMLAPHIEEHYKRWQSPSDGVNGWNSNTAVLLNYAQLRPEFARAHLRNQFSLGAERKLVVDVTDTAKGYIQVNTITINSSLPGISAQVYPWTGLYYPDVPVTLIARPRYGYSFVKWEGSVQGTKDTLVLTLSDSTFVRAVFERSTDSMRIVHYWHFNNLSSGTLTSADADYSESGSAVITYPGTGAGYLDATGSEDGTLLNVQFNELSGKALRPRNPANTRQLLIQASTEGFRSINLSYATQRTSNGAVFQRVYYSANNGATWKLAADSISIGLVFETKVIDFKTINEVNDKQQILFRIDFFGDNSAAGSGNNRFDNMVITGVPVTDSNVLVHYWHFNNLRSGYITSLNADSSRVPGAYINMNPGLMYATGAIGGTGLNTRNFQPAGGALRAEAVAGNRKVLLHLPTDGYQRIVLSYATARTVSEPVYQRVLYSPDEGNTWLLKADSLVIETGYRRVAVDFSDVPEASNNAGFMVRVEFFGRNASNNNNNSNTRFDNICVTGVPVTDSSDFIYYWHFNELPSEAIASIQADVTRSGSASISYPGNGSGYMDRTEITEGSGLNRQQYQASARALRVRNPSDIRTLLIQAPTTGYKNIIMRYAVQENSNGATFQRISYSPDGGTTWFIKKDSLPVSTNYEIKAIDFSDVPDAVHNPGFMIKTEFFGDNTSTANGNERFDNVTLSGIPLQASCAAIYTWTGAVNTEWNLAANWCAGVVPSVFSDVVVAAGAAHMPVITSGNITVHKLTVEPGAGIILKGGTLQATVWKIKGLVGYTADTDQEIIKAPHGAIMAGGKGNKIMTTDIVLADSLHLEGAARVLTNNFVLSVPAKGIARYSDSSFVATALQTGRPAETGGLQLTGIIKGSYLFPVSALPTGGNPCIIDYDGSINDLTVRVDTSVGVVQGLSAGKNVNLIWYITRSVQNTGMANITVKWDAGQEDQWFDRSQCTVVSYSGDRIENFGIMNASEDTGSGMYNVTATGVTEFTYFTVTNYSAIVPPKLFDFKGEANDTQINLSWNTSEQRNVLRYLLYRSMDNKNYSLVDSVSANNAVESIYLYPDKNAFKGINYYKLAMKASDGVIIDSASAMVQLKTAGNFLLYPNPVKDNVNIYVIAEQSHVENIVLYNITGHKVLQKTLQVHTGANVFTLRLKTLPAGVYILKTVAGGTHRLIKE
ncbi:MAG: CotH kinase family protein [Chitinophagaceae bacterium]